MGGFWDHVEAWESRYGRHATALALAAAAELFSFLLGSSLRHGLTSFTRFLDLVQTPFSPVPGQDPAFRARILGPVLAHLLGLRGHAALVVPVLANVPFYYVIYLVLRRRLPATAAAPTVFLLATTLVTMSSRMLLGFPDSLASLSIALCLLWPNPIAQGAVLFVGMFADERIAAVVPLILLWHFLGDRASGRSAWLRAVLQGTAMTLATLAFLIARSELLRHVGATAEDTNLRATLAGELLWQQVGALGIGYFFSFRAAWLLPIMYLLRCLRDKDWLVLPFGVATALALIPAALVSDISRVSAYAFPAVLTAVAGLAQLGDPDLRVYLKLATILNVFLPCGMIMGVGMHWLPGYPLPLEVLKNIKDGNGITLFPHISG